MSKLLLLSSMGAGPGRTVPVFASVAAHAVIAVAAGGGFGGWGAQGPSRAPVTEMQIEVEAATVALPVPVIADDSARRDSDGDHDEHQHAVSMPHAHMHSHAYPVAADHDAHPHSESIDHRLVGHDAEASVAPAPGVLASGDQGMPTFSIVLGRGGVSAGGVVGAVGSGTGAGTGTGTGVASAAEATFAEAMVSEHARLVSSLQPEYPAGARAQGVEAKVALEIVVDERGTVAHARVVKGAGYGFDDSALRAVRAARFSPARRGPSAVRVRMQWTVEFRLE
jgi:TonB family protein